MAGFANTQGRVGANTTLSANRAKAVLAAPKASGRAASQFKFMVRGYSELAPVACNDTPDNMQLNRRVEVWVK